MGLLSGLRKRLKFIYRLLFRKDKLKIGIYGPPNAGKTTLANRILRDWLGDIMGSPSEIPHETRRVKLREGVKIQVDGKSVTIDGGCKEESERSH
ncbi:MAG: GTPase [Archaeoglobaceae archaeon]|nr:GTPase [Archaeoglobaceae archaeon]